MHHTEGTFTAFDGLSIYHQTWAPDRPTGVVIVVHGLGEHSGRYGHVAEALVAAGYAVCALDHRGHGRSGGERVYVKSYDELQRDLSRFRQLTTDAHPGLPVFVLGHSMGGNLAVGHALDHQDGLRGLALSGAALQVGPGLTAAQIRTFKLIARIAPGRRLQGLDASALSRDPAVVEAYRNDPLVYTGKISAGIGAALIGAMQRFPDRYASLTVPIWIGHGTADRLVPIAGARELEARAVAAQVTSHYYDGLYHEIFNEPERDAVIGDLVAWLGTVMA